MTYVLSQFKHFQVPESGIITLVPSQMVNFQNLTHLLITLICSVTGSRFRITSVHAPIRKLTTLIYTPIANLQSLANQLIASVC